MKKNIYVVLGMARSGTSVIARGLKALGIDLGEKLTPGREAWNAKGFFEDTDIVYKINRGVLFAIDQPHLASQPLSSSKFETSAVQDLKKSAISLLKQRMVTSQYWGFKDPRTARLLPFWQEVFAALNLNEHYVIALRNPLSSAYSYQRLSGCDVEEALLLWLVHLVAAVEGTQGKDRVVVSYDLMLQDPHLQLNRVKLALNIPDLSDAAEIDAYADEFLDKKLHHYENNSDDLEKHAATHVVPLCAKVYDLLYKLAKDEIRFEDDAFNTAWQSIMVEFNAASPIYSYIDVLLKRNKQLQRSIRNTEKSILWKITYPLRMIDDVLRLRRHKAREKRRLIKAYE